MTAGKANTSVEDGPVKPLMGFHHLVDREPPRRPHAHLLRVGPMGGKRLNREVEAAGKGVCIARRNDDAESINLVADPTDVRRNRECSCEHGFREHAR